MPTNQDTAAIGIDIGGTHSDGALLSGTRLLAAAKTPTRHDDLLGSISTLLERLLDGRNADFRRGIARINLSTTLATNAIVTGSAPPVGVLVSGGPGIAAENYRCGARFHVIDGSLNHLGRETAPIDAEEAEAATRDCLEAGIRHFAVVGKFSPRNPEHEERIAAAVRAACPETVVCLGHRLSGNLNFGRRINTARCNAAVWDITRDFTGALAESLEALGLGHATVGILKADGGTLPLARALETPAQTILSGPAASVMGLVAALPLDEDAALFDIGGTTTDIALLIRGEPLLEREGITLAGSPTLVRALLTRSIALGGDSALRVEDGRVRVGPHRLGPCLAAGGAHPALMDALNVLGHAEFGDTAASRAGLAAMARAHGMEAETTARSALEEALFGMADALADFTKEINSKPVYTIHEMLAERRIAPKKLALIGGPAPVFAPLLEKRLGLPCLCPAFSGVTNAIGAALCRSTAALSLHADSARGLLTVPTLGLSRRIPRNYSLDEAGAEAKDLLQKDLAATGIAPEEADIQLTQADAFTMVEGGYATGRNIRVTAQVKPAVLGRLDAPAELAVITAG